MEYLLFASYLGAQMTAMKGLDGGIDRWYELQRKRRFYGKIGSNSLETESGCPLTTTTTTGGCRGSFGSRKAKLREKGIGSQRKRLRK